MSAPAASDLRVLIARRVGLGRRVAVLADDAALLALLRDNGCEALMNPPSLDALVAFSPQVVVGFDGLFSEGPRGVEALARAVPQAELLAVFTNAAGATQLLAALLGQTPPPSSTERDVRAWLTRAGYVVGARDLVVTSHQRQALAPQTEAALRQLFEQLNPDTAAERLLLVARRGAVASSPELEAGLTSLVIVGDDPAALEGTVRSAAGQLCKPLELVVVSRLDDAALEACCRAAKARADLRLVTVAGQPLEPLAATNLGLRRARGQRVCCLEAGELLDRTHLATLLELLEQSTAAWALSTGPGLTSNVFVLREWLAQGAVQRGRYVVDRARLGLFPFELAEGQPEAEAMLFCRLAALFEPAFVHAAPTLDSPRKPSASVQRLQALLATRPLRTITRLDEQLAPDVEPPLFALLEARLLERSEALGHLLGAAREWSARARSALAQARRDAREELDRRDPR